MSDIFEILRGPSPMDVLTDLYGDLPLDTPTKIGENEDVEAWITRTSAGLVGEFRPTPGGPTAEREAREAEFLAFIQGASTAIANLQVIIDTPQPTVTTFPQAQTAIRGLQTQVKDHATITQTLIEKVVALAQHVSKSG